LGVRRRDCRKAKGGGNCRGCERVSAAHSVLPLCNMVLRPVAGSMILIISS
jgi:hypothetical protein